VSLGLEYNLPVLFLRNAPNDAKIKLQYPAMVQRAGEIVKELDAKQLPMLDELAQFYGGATHDARKQNYLKCIRELKPGISEIIIHCGVDDAELQAITGSHANRDGDRRIFTDPDVMDEIKRLGIEVVSWKQLHEMAKKK
jgi:hypothetical protein